MLNVLNISILIILFIIITWSVYRWRNRIYFNLAQKLPSNKWQTLFGLGPVLHGKEIFSHTTRYGEKYGKNCVFWAGPYSFFITIEPQIIKEILLSEKCLERPSVIYNSVVILGGNGLLTDNEPVWSVHRKLFNKAFSHKILLSYIPIFIKESDSLLREIEITMEQGNEVHMWTLFHELTLKTSTATILKRNLELSKFNPKIMSKYMHVMFQYLAEITSNKILEIKWLRKFAEMFIYKKAIAGIKLIYGLISESLDIYEKNDFNDPSYLPEIKTPLDNAFQAVEQNILEKHEIRGQIIHLFTAAFETTSSTLFMVITLLAMHPIYQEQAYEEIVNVLNDNDNSDITIEKLDQLIYLERIINETMRLLPLIPLISRKVGNIDLELSNGLTLPAGQHIFIDIYRLQRCKDIWGPNANLFNPDNFLPENLASKHTFAFIPFTKGPRICIGWRYSMIFAKICLIKLIKTYKFSTDFKYDDLELESHITLTFKQEPKIEVERRK